MILSESTSIVDLLRVNACEICKSEESRLFGEYRIQLEGHGLDKTVWKLVECADCGLIYLNPRPQQQLFGGFAADEARDLSQRRAWRSRLAIMSRFVSPGKLLDVGSGAGAFLHYAQAAGWHVEGLEIQEEFATRARETFSVPIHIGTIADLAVGTERFDAVTMWDVLEHVPSVEATLSAAAQLLRPGGLLALSTIHGGSLNARMFRGRWIFWNRLGFVPEHLRAFTRRSLRIALSRSGFAAVLLKTHFAAGAILEPLSRRLLPEGLSYLHSKIRPSFLGRASAFAIWRATEMLGSPLNLTKLGDIIEVYALRR